MLLGDQRPRVEVGPALALPGLAGSPGREVCDLAAACGVQLDPWQAYVIHQGLCQGDDGRFLALMVALLVSRQNGKSAILAAVALGAIEVLGLELVIYTAHEFKTALEIFALCCDMVHDGPLRRRFKATRRSGVETGIEFRNGARLRFLARSRSSGRGFSADLVMLDEAFALLASQLGALLPTLSARPNPQVWLASSAPMHDSEALHQVRARALGEEPGSLAYFEWSAEPGAAPADRRAWAAANPALGYRLSERFIEAELAAMPVREFERERLGIGDESDGATAFDVARWQGLADPDSKVLRPLAMAWDITPERDAAAISVAGVRADGTAHVEVVEHIPGTDWLLARMVELWGRWKVPFWCESASPAASLVEPLEAKNVAVKTHPRGGGADALFADAIQNGSVRHLGQASLTSALIGSRWRISGDTRSYSRGSSATDICPLKAAALAHYGAMVEPALVVANFGVY